MEKFFKWLNSIPLVILIFGALFLGLAPFVPEPHIVEKVRMLATGTLHKPIDIFDLFYHSLPVALLIMRLAGSANRGQKTETRNQKPEDRNQI